MQIHQVGDVFTPASIAGVTFVEREAINEELVDSLRTKGKQLVVYGHSGCGKTTLVENKLRQLFAVHIKTQCMKSMTFEQILADPLRQLNVMYLAERQTKATRSLTASASTGTLARPAIGLTYASTDEAGSKQIAIAPAIPTPHIVAENLGINHACWVLEDFHKVDNAEKIKLAQCMKMFMDLSERFPDLKMIFIGAVNSARDVIQFDPELRHRVSEIQVPLMSNAELSKLISLGESCLNISIDHRITERIIVISNGLAAVSHQIALHFCNARGVKETQPTKMYLDTTGWPKALEKYLKESSATLKAAFDKSVKSMKKRKYDHGRVILKALTKFPQEGACQADILAAIRTFVTGYPASGLAAHLQHLQSEDRGAIITYDDMSGNFSFSEPVHRAFCYSIFESEDKTNPAISRAENIESMLLRLIPEIAERMAKYAAKQNGV